MRKITSKYIAEKAGVSQATVSYILNNTQSKNISKETRQKVLRIAKELNYIPNSAAQQLRRKDTKCIAIRISTNLANRRYCLMLQGIRSATASEGYSLLLCGVSNNNQPYPDYITAYLSKQADGIIYISSDNLDLQEKDLETIKKNNIPVSVVDCLSDIEDISSISYDYFATTYERVKILLERGFKKFVYIRPRYENKKEDLRQDGVMSALAGKDVQLSIEKTDYIDINASIFASNTAILEINKTNRNLIKNLVYSNPTDTAYVCSSIEIGDEVSRYLYERSLIEPEAFKHPWSENIISYHFNHFDIGREAARLLLNSLKTNDQTPVKLCQKPILDFFQEDSF